MVVGNLFISNSDAMKKFFTFIGYLLAVVALFFVLDYGCGKLLDKFCLLDNDPSLKYAHQGGGGEKIAILGASRAKHHYKPSIFEKELNASSFNYGMDGRNIFNQYIVANELLSNASNKPELILLEIASIDIEDTPGWNGEKLSNLFPLYKENEKVREIVDLEDQENGFTLRYVNLYRFNSSFLDFIKYSCRKSHEDEMRGYVPLFSEWKNDAEIVGSSGTFYEYNHKELYLKRLINMCQENDVKIVVYNSPDYKIVTNKLDWEEKIQTICDESGVTFINHAHDSLFLAHKEWFNEPFHLNDVGAEYYSIIVANEIKDFFKNGR